MSECKTKTFVSCIKVKGIHLLAPVITEKRRTELERYKQQAIKLEKRLKSCRELKKSLEELLNFQPLESSPQSHIFLKNDDHATTLGITETGQDASVLLKNKALRKITLSKDIVDITQYNNDGIKVIRNGSDINYADDLSQGYNVNGNDSAASFNQPSNFKLSHSEDDTGYPHNIEKCDIIYSKADDTSKIDEVSLSNVSDHSVLINTFKNMSPEKSPRPRLIRSNSYTLESPSPILLAHLEKNRKKCEQKNFGEFKQLSTSRNWASLENNYVPFENSDFSSINTVYNNNEANFNKEDVTCGTPADKDDLKKSASPTIEVIQTDISVQQITVNTNDSLNDMDKCQLHEENKIKNMWDISNSNSQLMQILKNIPEKYSKQIIELIEKQRLDQQRKVDDFEKFKKTVLDNCPEKGQFNSRCNESQKAAENIEVDIHQEYINENMPHLSPKSDFSNDNINSQNEIEQNSMHHSISFSDSDKLHSSITSVSPSQSIHYTITPSDTFRPPSSPSVKLIDLDYEDYKTESGNHETSGRLQDVLELYVREGFKNLDVSRELFPQITTVWTIKQEWAASIIGAHVKGYLTRRLLRTEKVQTLIDTIKDALICALQLHNAENIDESDVELHRRLINQVSAACYAFHDVFFRLSVQEQMLIISTDRQRRIEKAKRPASAPSSRRSKSSSSSSSRSSKHRYQLHSQSLTKV